MPGRTTSRMRRPGEHQKDTGWSWVVMIAHFSVLLIMVGIQKCNGIFFVEILQKFEVSASMASVVTGVAAACASIVVIFVMTCAVNVISERQCVMIGTAILTVSMAWCSFAVSFPVFVVALGALQGVGASFIYGPSFVILGKYFSRHLTSAQAFATTGVSVGGAIVPLIVRAVIDEFSFPAGLLLVGGLQANMFISALLFRPVPQRQRVDVLIEANDAGSGEVSAYGDAETEIRKDRNVKPSAITGVQDPATKSEFDGNGDVLCSLNRGKSEDTPLVTETKSDRNGNVAWTQSLEHELSGWAVASQKAIAPGSGKEHCNNKVPPDLYSVSDIEIVINGDIIRKRGIRRHRSVSEIANNTDNEPAAAQSTMKSLISSMQNLSPRKRRNQEHLSGGDDDDGDEEEGHGNGRHSLLDRLSSSGVITSLSSIPEAVYISLGGLGRSQCSVPHSGRSVCSASDGFVTARSAESVNDADPEEDLAGKAAVRSGGCGCADKFDVSVCRSGAFWAVVFIQAFGFLVGALGPAFLPPLAKEKGLTDKQAAHLLTLLSGLDIMSRLLPGLIAHYRWMKPTTMVSLSLFLIGALCQTTRLLDTYPAMLAFCAIFGTFSGVFFAMSPAVIIEFTGLERFATAFGFIQLFLGISAASTNILLGSLKDWTGTYATSFHFLGATSFFSSTLLASLSYVKHKQQVTSKDTSSGSPLASMEIQVPSNGIEIKKT